VLVCGYVRIGGGRWFLLRRACLLEGSSKQGIAFMCVRQQSSRKSFSYHMTDRYIEYRKAHLSKGIGVNAAY
jgi:hypothetical protein